MQGRDCDHVLAAAAARWHRRRRRRRRRLVSTAIESVHSSTDLGEGEKSVWPSPELASLLLAHD